MPESAEVRRIVDKLRSRLTGQSLLFITWITDTKYSKVFDHTWSGVSNRFPTICVDIISRGKQIFFFLENGLAFVSGLGMEGHWYYFENVDSVNKYLSDKHHPKFCLHFGQKFYREDVLWCVSETQVWYDDSRNFGNFSIVTWNDAFHKIKEIGPDWLAVHHPLSITSVMKDVLPKEFYRQVTLTEFQTIITAPSRSKMELCRFLMNQKYLSGCGNWVKTEVLYRASLHPHRLLGSLSSMEIALLFESCLDIIDKAHQHGGLTHGTFLDPDMEKGTYPVKIYKLGNQLDEHGHMITKIKTRDGRSTYLVEEIQRE